MALTASEIQKMILDVLPGSDVQVQDMRGDGSQFAAHVVSKDFIGKNRVQQHQMVYKALKGKVGEELHALSVQTSAPK
ncbi:MAG: BolA/IbaG family iron-sulfur metabolism protein [Emcibacteraceae bacterium]|nr:BolA/IbaG family iron-sulfur metabolism protein [Emcibacteraceae bacterium]